jgi:hypothetical protein
MERAHIDGVVTGPPKTVLRLEGAAMLAASVLFYAEHGRSWLLFALLLLVPDVGMVGYVAGSRLGATTYNLLHTVVGPAALLVIGLLTDDTLSSAIAMIWIAHIGMDRALGYGLKYGDSFGHTHLGTIGRRARPAQ